MEPHLGTTPPGIFSDLDPDPDPLSRARRVLVNRSVDEIKKSPDGCYRRHGWRWQRSASWKWRLPRRVLPHLLRHSIAVVMLRGGADIRHDQALLGHASVETT
ncbi:MAG TPA: tyrosine-type recombinase/integrase [Planctomycetota bacterium]|nr:tyrosine-type recombinase/integrase [Planctomycetota bacterium]